MILAIVLYSITGFTITLSKILLSYTTPLFLVGTRMFIAGLLLSIFALRKRLTDYRPDKYDWFLILQFTVFGVIIPHICRSWALQYLPTVKAAILFNLGPLFAAVFGYIFLKEKLSLIQTLGLCIGFAGTVPILLATTCPEEALMLFSGFSIPDVMMLIATASLSYSLISMQHLVKHRHCSPFFANGMSMLIGGLFAFNASLLIDPIWMKKSVGMFIALLTVNILASNFICANLQAWLLKHHSPTFMTFASFLSPVFAALYSWLLLGEHISWSSLLSLIVVLVGLGIYYYDETRTKVKPA